MNCILHFFCSIQDTSEYSFLRTSWPHRLGHHWLNFRLNANSGNNFFDSLQRHEWKWEDSSPFLPLSNWLDGTNCFSFPSCLSFHTEDGLISFDRCTSSNLALCKLRVLKQPRSQTYLELESNEQEMTEVLDVNEFTLKCQDSGMQFNDPSQSYIYLLTEYCCNRPDGDYEFPYSSCSNTYFTCSNDYQYNRSCASGLVFNQKMDLCVSPSVIGCSGTNTFIPNFEHFLIAKNWKENIELLWTVRSVK